MNLAQKPPDLQTAADFDTSILVVASASGVTVLIFCLVSCIYCYRRRHGSQDDSSDELKDTVHLEDLLSKPTLADPESVFSELSYDCDTSEHSHNESVSSNGPGFDYPDVIAHNPSAGGGGGGFKNLTGKGKSQSQKHLRVTRSARAAQKTRHSVHSELTPAHTKQSPATEFLSKERALTTSTKEDSPNSVKKLKICKDKAEQISVDSTGVKIHRDSVCHGRNSFLSSTRCSFSHEVGHTAVGNKVPRISLPRTEEAEDNQEKGSGHNTPEQKRAGTACLTSKVTTTQEETPPRLNPARKSLTAGGATVSENEGRRSLQLLNAKAFPDANSRTDKNVDDTDKRTPLDSSADLSDGDEQTQISKRRSLSSLQCHPAPHDYTATPRTKTFSLNLKIDFHFNQDRDQGESVPTVTCSTIANFPKNVKDSSSNTSLEKVARFDADNNTIMSNNENVGKEGTNTKDKIEELSFANKGQSLRNEFGLVIPKRRSEPTIYENVSSDAPRAGDRNRSFSAADSSSLQPKKLTPESDASKLCKEATANTARLVPNGSKRKSDALGESTHTLLTSSQNEEDPGDAKETRLSHNVSAGSQVTPQVVNVIDGKNDRSPLKRNPSIKDGSSSKNGPVIGTPSSISGTNISDTETSRDHATALVQLNSNTKAPAIPESNSKRPQQTEKFSRESTEFKMNVKRVTVTKDGEKGQESTELKDNVNTVIVTVDGKKGHESTELKQNVKAVMVTDDCKTEPGANKWQEGLRKEIISSVKRGESFPRTALRNSQDETQEISLRNPHSKGKNLAKSHNRHGVHVTKADETLAPKTGTNEIQNPSNRPSMPTEKENNCRIPILYVDDDTDDNDNADDEAEDEGKSEKHEAEQQNTGKKTENGKSRFPVAQMLTRYKKDISSVNPHFKADTQRGNVPTLTVNQSKDVDNNDQSNDDDDDDADKSPLPGAKMLTRYKNDISALNPRLKADTQRGNVPQIILKHSKDVDGDDDEGDYVEIKNDEAAKRDNLAEVSDESDYDNPWDNLDDAIKRASIRYNRRPSRIAAGDKAILLKSAEDLGRLMEEAEKRRQCRQAAVRSSCQLIPPPGEIGVESMTIPFTRFSPLRHTVKGIVSPTQVTASQSSGNILQKKPVPVPKPRLLLPEDGYTRPKSYNVADKSKIPGLERKPVKK